MRLLNIKYQIPPGISAFVLAALLGSWIAGAFEGHLVRFYIQETFTLAEAEQYIGKEVVLTQNKLAGTRGKVVSVYRADDGVIFVRVNFPRFLDKEDQTIGFCKNSFRHRNIELAK